MATSLTPLQIAQVRQIVGGGISLDAIKNLLDELSTEETAETLEDINDWVKVRKKFMRIEGGRNGVVIDKADNRLAIRNFVRERLGLPTVLSFIEESGGASSSYTVYSAPIECKKY